MDPYVEIVQTLFNYARSQFKDLKTFFFHNTIYDYLWEDPPRRYKAFPVDDLVRQAEAAVQSNYRTRVQSEPISELQRLAAAFNRMIEEIERSLIEKAFAFTNFNQSKTAQLLKMKRDRLRYRMKIHRMKAREDN